MKCIVFFVIALQCHLTFGYGYNRYNNYNMNDYYNGAYVDYQDQYNPYESDTAVQPSYQPRNPYKGSADMNGGGGGYGGSRQQYPENVNGMLDWMQQYSYATRTTTTERSFNEGDFTAICIRSCPVTSEYNPVCGTDNVTYQNPGRLECAQNCGVRVKLNRLSACSAPVIPQQTTTSTTKPTTVTRVPSTSRPSTTIITTKPTTVTRVPSTTATPLTTKISTTTESYINGNGQNNGKGNGDDKNVNTGNQEFNENSNNSNQTPLTTKISTTTESYINGNGQNNGKGNGDNKNINTGNQEFNENSNNSNQTPLTTKTSTTTESYINGNVQNNKGNGDKNVNTGNKGFDESSNNSNQNNNKESNNENEKGGSGGSCNSGVKGPSVEEVMACTQLCPLSSEYNPVCGTDGITYSNPGRLLCSQYCGIDVKVKKFSACSSNVATNFYTNCQCPTFTNPPNTEVPVTMTTPTFVQSCIDSCPSSLAYMPVCGSNNLTYPNLDHLNCAKRCGIEVTLKSLAACADAGTNANPVVRPTEPSIPSPQLQQDCIRQCSVNMKYEPICGTDNITYNNTGHLICARQCGVEVEMKAASACSDSKTPSCTPSTPTKPPVGPNGLNFTIPPDVLASIFPEETKPTESDEVFDIDQRFKEENNQTYA